jgi:hypothetical protein
MAWLTKKANIDNTRATIPFYRDVRDRSTWELLDTMYYNVIDLSPPNSPPDAYEITSDSGTAAGTFFAAFRRILRKDETGAYFWDGTILNFNGFNSQSTAVSGANNLNEDFHIILPNNSGMLSAYALYNNTFGGEATSVFTTVPFVIYTVTTATGIWVSATSVIISFDNETGEREVRIFRALN